MNHLQRQLAGWGMILFGIIGTILPVLQGAPFIVLGIFLLKEEKIEIFVIKVQKIIGTYDKSKYGESKKQPGTNRGRARKAR